MCYGNCFSGVSIASVSRNSQRWWFPKETQLLTFSIQHLWKSHSLAFNKSCKTFTFTGALFVLSKRLLRKDAVASALSNMIHLDCHWHDSYMFGQRTSRHGPTSCNIQHETNLSYPRCLRLIGALFVYFQHSFNTMTAIANQHSS